jgi:hypothetical protein
MGRLRLVVSYDKRDGTWVIKGSDGSGNTAEGGFRTKTDAIAEAARRGRQSGDAQLLIKKRDGKLESERTYGTHSSRSRG